MRILLCDDHVLLTEALESLLRSAGHEVLVAHTPVAALNLLAVHRPDVCLLDGCFPSQNPADEDGKQKRVQRQQEVRNTEIQQGENVQIYSDNPERMKIRQDAE